MPYIILKLSRHHNREDIMKKIIIAVCTGAAMCLTGCGNKAGDTIVNNYYDTTIVNISGDSLARWQMVGTTGYGNEVRALAVSGDYLIAGTYWGLYRSSDSGITWTASNSGLPASPAVLNVSSFGSTVFCLLDFTGVYGRLYRSSNSGGSWYLTGIPDSFYTICPAAKGDTLYTFYATDDLTYGIIPAGIFRSTDDGATWQKTGFPDSVYVYGIFESGGAVLAGTWDQGLFRSIDKGVSWSADTTIRDRIASFTLCGGAVFAGGSSSFWRSTDNGATWGHSTLYLNSLRSMTTCDNKLFVSGSKGICISYDNGTTWTMLGGWGVIAATSSYLFGGSMSEIWRLSLAGL
jgi:hypothetical protein